MVTSVGIVPDKRWTRERHGSFARASRYASWTSTPYHLQGVPYLQLQRLPDGLRMPMQVGIVQFSILFLASVCSRALAFEFSLSTLPPGGTPPSRVICPFRASFSSIRLVLAFVFVLALPSFMFSRSLAHMSNTPRCSAFRCVSVLS